MDFDNLGVSPQSSLFVGCDSHDLFRAALSILVQFPSRRFSMALVIVQVVDPYTNTDSTVALKKFLFNLSFKFDFQILFIAFSADQLFANLISRSFSVDDIQLPRYLKSFTLFISFPFKLFILFVLSVLSIFRVIYSVFAVLMFKPISFDTSSNLFRSVFASFMLSVTTARSSAQSISVIFIAGWRLLFLTSNVKPKFIFMDFLRTQSRHTIKRKGANVSPCRTPARVYHGC